ncbi:MAG: fibronectin type III domain-containing protein [Myxococcota bacterium]|nr:fibronectin type III domain-containing protein [Myxococcota bacterium]
MRFQWLTSAVLVVMFTLGGCGDPARTSNTRTETPEVPATREAPKNTTVPMGTGAMALSADGLFKLHIPPNGFSDVVVVSIQKQPEAPTPAIGVTPSYRVTWSPKSATITPSTPATDTQAAVNIEFSAYYFMSPEEVEATGEANLAQGLRTSTTGDYVHLTPGAYDAEKGYFKASISTNLLHATEDGLAGDFAAVNLSLLETCICDTDAEACDPGCVCDTVCTNPPPTTHTNTCEADEWQCNNGQCILAGYECDISVDCDDGSDEDSHCPTTDPNPGSGTGTGSSNVSPDTYEPDNTYGQATPIENGATQTHSLSSGDVDFVTFTLAEASDVILETSGTTPGDTRLWLYNESHDQIAYNDDGGVSMYSKIHATPLPAGVYYASVTGFSGITQIPSYTLSFTAAVPLDPAPADLHLSWNTETEKLIATWTESSTAVSYNVYYDDDATAPFDPAQQANEGPGPISTTETTQSLSGFAMGTTVFVTIKGVNADGTESYGTEVKSVMIPLAEDPYEPDNAFETARFIESEELQTRSIHVGGDYDYVRFTLNHTSDVTLETDGPVSGDTVLYLYNGARQQIAYDDASGNGLFSRIANQRLPAGDYFAMVRTYFASYTIATYTLKATIVSALDAPTNVVATPGDGSVTLSWDPVATATGYKVFYDDDSTAPFDPATAATEGDSPIKIEDAGTTSLTLTGLTNESIYYFAVIALSDTGKSEKSTVVSAIPSENPGDPSAGAPAAPANLTVNANEGAIVLTWDAVENATGYKVYYDDDTVNPPYSPGRFATEGISPLPTSEPTLTLHGLPTDIPLYFAVTALNGVHESDYSLQITLTPPQESAPETDSEPEETDSASEPESETEAPESASETDETEETESTSETEDAESTSEAEETESSGT